MISDSEHDELMAFLEPRQKELWAHENKVRSTEEQLFGFQVGFGKPDIYKYRIKEDTEIYLVYNTGFKRIIRDRLEGAFKKYPDKFGTGNADDVIDAMYNVSGFPPYETRENFIKYVKENNCCYVVYRMDNSWMKEILRIDMFRMLKESPNDVSKKEFVGGLLHTLKHFSLSGRYLSTGQENYDLINIDQLVSLIANAFLLKKGDGHKFESVQIFGNVTMYASFFREEESEFFFLNTYYRKS